MKLTPRKAVKALFEGKKIRLSSWNKNEYWKLCKWKCHILNKNGKVCYSSAGIDNYYGRYCYVRGILEATFKENDKIWELYNEAPILEKQIKDLKKELKKAEDVLEDMRGITLECDTPFIISWERLKNKVWSYFENKGFV